MRRGMCYNVGMSEVSYRRNGMKFRKAGRNTLKMKSAIDETPIGLVTGNCDIIRT